MGDAAHSTRIEVEETIGQGELRRYRTLADESRRVEAAHGALRRSLIARLQSGARTEPGRLTATLARSEAQRFSFEAMVRILGLDRAEAIRDRLPISASDTLKVHEAP